MGMPKKKETNYVALFVIYIHSEELPAGFNIVVDPLTQMSRTNHVPVSTKPKETKQRKKPKKQQKTKQPPRKRR